MIFFNLAGAGMLITALLVLIGLMQLPERLETSQEFSILFACLFLLDLIYRFSLVKKEISNRKQIVQATYPEKEQAQTKGLITKLPTHFGALLSYSGGHILFLPVWVWGIFGILGMLLLS
ncbi:MAG: hypothetical protein HKN88_08435 [Gammaproteobacteria bacterium]|nr:hypothetical protein [Gammaproteobacteria bacterium]NNC98088.1 hypothetical protein [Gammaproteobacteria bacterium]NNM13152.1 hypothetical protein [Gammaproteobacteria bacterium]